MPTLYPKNYTEPVKQAIQAKDKIALKTFIKSLAIEPIAFEEIVKLVDKKYVETNDENYHFLSDEITKVAAEIQDEWHPVQEESAL